MQALASAAAALGVDNAQTYINNFSSELHKLNLEGKSQEEIAAMISGAISSDLDKLTEQVIPWIGAFQKAGEQYLETMGRVLYEMEVVNSGFEKLGYGFASFGHMAALVSDAFIQASGGLDNALGSINGYIDNFYTDAEKQALRVKELSKSSGIFGDDTAYKKAVDDATKQASNGSTAAAELLAELLRNQGKYKEYFDYMNKLAEDDLNKKKEIADKELQLKSDELAFHKDILARIESAYTGSLNYMNSIERGSALSAIAINKLNSGDTQGYFNTLYKELEYEKKTATTREQYAVEFDKYIAELKGAEFEPKTTDDVVETLEELIEQNKRIEDAIANGSYQAPFVP
jgi:hypothetical protein